MISTGALVPWAIAVAEVIDATNTANNVRRVMSPSVRFFIDRRYTKTTVLAAQPRPLPSTWRIIGFDADVAIDGSAACQERVNFVSRYAGIPENR